jgi:hypothetical protein
MIDSFPQMVGGKENSIENNIETNENHAVFFVFRLR